MRRHLGLRVRKDKGKEKCDGRCPFDQVEVDQNSADHLNAVGRQLPEEPGHSLVSKGLHDLGNTSDREGGAERRPAMAEIAGRRMAAPPDA